MKSKLYLLICVTCFSLIFANRSLSQCATFAYISNGGNCISLSWYPLSELPDQVPVSLQFDGDLYAFTSGNGEVAFPAVYKKTTATCELPSELVNGNVTITLLDNTTYTCQFPQGTLLAIRDLSFDATATSQGNTLKWSIKQDNSADNYEVQRSVDGSNFSAIKTLKSKGAADQGSYSYNDAQPLTTSFYRLKVADKDGSKWFSKIIKVQNDFIKQGVTVYPNPNKGSFIISGITATELSSLAIYDAQGRKLSFQKTNINDANKSASIVVNSQTTGVLFVQYISGNEKMHTRFLVQ